MQMEQQNRVTWDGQNITPNLSRHLHSGLNRVITYMADPIPWELQVIRKGKSPLENNGKRQLMDIIEGLQYVRHLQPLNPSRNKKSNQKGKSVENRDENSTRSYISQIYTRFVTGLPSEDTNAAISTSQK